VPQETDAEKVARLEHEIEQLKQEMERLRRALDEALRAAKRQAAPFSRRGPKANPQKPGRKAGACYGRTGHRAVPPTVDQTLEAELPPKCPHCGGGITENDVFDQYQTEMPEPRVERIRFRVHVGCCQQCGRPLQGRHPRQTSDASGAAASQLGPRAVALATQLNKGLELPYGKTSVVLKQAFGLEVTPGGHVRRLPAPAARPNPLTRG
jgi:transposase